MWPVDCISPEHGKDFYWTGRAKKGKHIPHYTWEGWLMERCPHVLFSGGWFHLESKWPAWRLLSPVAYMIWLRVSQRAEQVRGRVWHRCHSQEAGWTTSLITRAPVTEVLSGCAAREKSSQWSDNKRQQNNNKTGESQWEMTHTFH